MAIRGHRSLIRVVSGSLPNIGRLKRVWDLSDEVDLADQALVKPEKVAGMKRW